jgi:rRNA maturation RNase YbeY
MFDIKSTVRRATSLEVARRIPFEHIATAILGSSYELSLVICGDVLATKMNKKYRKKSYRPNVLSFPITKTEGEIFVNLRCAEREARTIHVPLRNRLALLFVHGCFHLKGLDHSDSMERAEQKILKRFNL